MRFTDHASACPSPPTSLLFSTKHKQAGKSHNKVFRMKQVHVGMDPQKTTKQGVTTICLHHPYSYILCHFANCTHQKTLYISISLMHNSSFTHINMALSTAHSTPFCLQDNPYLPRSAAINLITKLTPQHALQTQHSSWTPQLLHIAILMEHICHAK